MLCYLYLLLLLSGCFYFLALINFNKFRDTAPLQPKVTKEVSRKVVTLEIQEVTNKRVMSTLSYHLCYTECVSKIMERSCIVIPENFKQEVLKDGFLRKKQIGNHQLRRDKPFLHNSLFKKKHKITTKKWAVLSWKERITLDDFLQKKTGWQKTKYLWERVST